MKNFKKISKTCQNISSEKINTWDYLSILPSIPENQKENLISQLAKRHPNTIDEINTIISRISSLVSKLPPLQLLIKTWQHQLISNRHVRVEADIGPDELVSMRMIEYIQSMIASTKINQSSQTSISEKDWNDLVSMIFQLYEKINNEYFFTLTAKNKSEDKSLDLIMEEFSFKAQMYWCNLRGNYYPIHQISILSDLIEPQSDLIHSVYQITSSDLIKELERIWNSLSFGIFDAKSRIEEIRNLVLNDIETSISTYTMSTDDTIPIMMKKSSDRLGLTDELNEKLNMIFGDGLFELTKITNLPKKFLDDFSWKPAEDIEFLSEGEFKGWPLRILPTFKRPFISIDGKYYCFDISSLFDNFFRQMEKRIFSVSEKTKQQWIENRKLISEKLPIDYFNRILPGAHFISEVYYPSVDIKGGPAKWCESDSICMFDDHLFIIEIKAGAFTYTSPATDLPAYIESIKNLVVNPSKQGSRFLNYLKSGSSVKLYNLQKKVIRELSFSDFRVITICAITLDPFTEIAAQVQHLKPIGIELGDDSTWPMSLSDLSVYADIFEGPMNFLHYVEKRKKAATSPDLKLEDELDHLGLYYKYNDYVEHTKILKSRSGNSEVVFQGYRSDIDRFFLDKALKKTTQPPGQAMPELWQTVISYLNRNKIEGHAKLSSLLLDLPFDTRIDLSTMLVQELNSKSNPRPVSIYGAVNISFFITTQDGIDDTFQAAFEHTKVILAASKESNRTMLLLAYNESMVLVGLRTATVTLSALDNAHLNELAKKAGELTERRIEKSQLVKGKLGRNDICLCGSGKKFKKCCLKNNRL